MRNLKFLLVLSLTLSLVGCSAPQGESRTTGGSVGGLAPAAKKPRGTINNGVFTAQDDFFSIEIPYSEGSYEYQYMQIKEERDGSGRSVYVSFGPAAFNQSIYRVIRYDRTMFSDSEEAALAQKILDDYQNKLQVRGSEAEEVSYSSVVMNESSAWHAQLKQVVPAGQISNHAVDLVHEVYIIYFADHESVFLVAVEMPQITAVPLSPGLDPEAFARSLTLQ